LHITIPKISIVVTIQLQLFSANLKVATKRYNNFIHYLNELYL